MFVVSWIIIWLWTSRKRSCARKLLW